MYYFGMLILIVTPWSVLGAKLECNVSIDAASAEELPPIIFEAEHFYGSNTNGESYKRTPAVVGSVRLDGTKRSDYFIVDASNSNKQKVKFDYNGTHICSTPQLRLETDTCWMHSEPGCYNKTNACNSLCFPSTQYYRRHRLKVFRSLTSSGDIGTWEMGDDVSLYTMPYKRLLCLHGNDSFTHWADSSSPAQYPNLEKVTCPPGHRCRITTGKESYASPIQTYVGCERDSRQYDGCEGGCTVLEWHKSPDGGSKRWVNMCKYCCLEPLCNNPVKCSNLKCDLSASLKHNSCNHVGLPECMYLVNTVILILLHKISLF